MLKNTKLTSFSDNLSISLDSAIEKLLPSQAFINQMPNCFTVSDLNSQFLLANNTSIQWFGFKSLDAMTGKIYADMPCRAAEQHANFMQQDEMILQNKGHGKIIGLYCYHNYDWKIVFAEKYPLKNEQGEIIALVTHISDMTNSSFIDINKFVSLVLQNNSIRFYEQKGYLVEESPPTQFALSPRLSECLFFLIRGDSAKDIAVRLGISSRTVECYIDQLKINWNCNSKSELIQKALSLGYMNKIPASLLHECKR